MRDLLTNLFLWNPWLNFFTEVFFLQLFFLFTSFLFILSKNFFFSSVYSFLFFFLSGIFLAYFNLEFLTGFLYVVEVTVFFILLLFFFFLNADGSFYTKKKNFLFTFLFFFLFFQFYYYEGFFLILNLFFFWNSYYEALYYSVLNDIHGLFLSYYYFNSLIFFIFGFLIFLTSVLCILMLKNSKTSHVEAIFSTTNLIKFFEQMLSFEFIRQQNLNFQSLRKPVNTINIKKYKEWSKKEQD